MIFVARWLQGAAPLEWLIANPDWYEWADICAVAHEGAQADIAKRNAEPA